MPGAPLIETDRLLLRPHALRDFDESLAMWSDPVVTRFIGGKPSTPQQVWMRIVNYAGLWSLLGFGYWAVTEKASGAFVGEVGFADFHRDIDASMQAVPEMGWGFLPRAHGRGFATEAVRAAIAWGDASLDSPRTVCLIGSENLASRRVAEKCGFVKFRDTHFQEEPTMFFERRRSRSSVDLSQLEGVGHVVLPAALDP